MVQKIGGPWPNQASSSALAGAKRVLWMMGFNKTGKDDDKLHRDLSLVLFRQARQCTQNFHLSSLYRLTGHFIWCLVLARCSWWSGWWVCMVVDVSFQNKLLWLMFWYVTYALDKFLLGRPKSLQCLLAFSNLGFQNRKTVISIKVNFDLQQHLLINMENDLIKKKETRHTMWFWCGVIKTIQAITRDSLTLGSPGFIFRVQYARIH